VIWPFPAKITGRAAQTATLFSSLSHRKMAVNSTNFIVKLFFQNDHHGRYYTADIDWLA